MRAELAILRTARAAAALRGNEVVPRRHARSVAPLPRTPQPRSSRSNAAALPSLAKALCWRARRSEPSPQHSPFNSSSSQPLTPKEVHPNSIPLSAMQKPRILSLPKPLFAGRHLTASMTATSRFETCRLSGGPVLWQASLLQSLKRGWQPVIPIAAWVRSALQPGRRLSALLDASRSTGAAAFTAVCPRNTFWSRAKRQTRVTFADSRDNQVSWLVEETEPLPPPPKNFPPCQAQRAAVLLPRHLKN
jgi:hypothetical protein